LRQLSAILDTLESFHGPQAPPCPTDPYLFLVWWHCGYPASEERCGRGWKSLNEEIGTSPERLLATPSSRLSRALEPGGMIPELRAGRLKQIAQQVQEQCNGDLNAALRRIPLNKARALLKKFPGIADPGADRILLFGEIATIAAVPSSCPQVLVRIESGRTHESYDADYREAQQIIQKEVPETFAARTRAYLLIQRHGQRICKRSSPQCRMCPIAGACVLVAGTSRGGKSQRRSRGPARRHA
jgi:endonuclease III